MECASENDVVCEDVQTPSVGSVEDSEVRKEDSGGPGEQLEEDEDVQCSDGGGGSDGDECHAEIGEELREDAAEDGSEEQLEDAEEVPCHDVDLDYVDEERDIVEKEEIVAEELDDEHNPKRSDSSEVSCVDSVSEELSQYSSTQDNFLESGVVCEEVQTLSVSRVEDSEEREEVSGGTGEQLEEDEDVQCSDGGSCCLLYTSRCV